MLFPEFFLLKGKLFYRQKSNHTKRIIAVHLIYNQIFSYGQLCSPPFMWHKLKQLNKLTKK